MCTLQTRIKKTHILKIVPNSTNGASQVSLKVTKVKFYGKCSLFSKIYIFVYFTDQILKNFSKFFIIYQFSSPVFLLYLDYKRCFTILHTLNNTKLTQKKFRGNRLHPFLVYEVIKRPCKMSKIPIFCL